jgi:ubiquinone/menaquinone biosynthesis C-methylase UbiE
VQDRTLRDAWEGVATQWLAWSRRPGHDSYWAFHREAFLPLVPGPGKLTVDIGCGEGRLGRDLAADGHRVLCVDASMTMARAATAHPDNTAAVVVADAAALPVRSASADLAIAFMSLQDVDAFETAIAEAAAAGLCRSAVAGRLPRREAP